MSIFNHFQNINLTKDQETALEKLTSFLQGDDSIFMLKGYAGTGKTTLIGGLVSFLSETKRTFEVMALTGRAAKILREKTNFGKTVHSCIYKLEEVQFTSNKINPKNEEKDESYKLIFPLRKLEQEKSVLIIDEASMISSKRNENPLYKFGSDILLKDLLTYAQPHTLKTKIIFVGDPAQLPPVGDNKSWAFEPNLFTTKKLTVSEAILREVKRQSDNLILKNASAIRDKIVEPNPAELTFEYDDSSFVQLSPDQLFSRYVDEVPMPEIKEGVIVAFSNMQCFHYNNAIRAKYFPDNKDIVPGDIIQIVHNNYKTYPTEIYNGDFAKILEVGNSTKELSAPVWVEENGKRFKKNITLKFRKIQMLLDHYDEPIDCIVLDSLLNSPNRDLNYDEMRALYINFIMRFDAEQKKRKEQGLPIIKRYSEEFKQLLLSDPYLNAIRCKYGYAITCHKAQGGEWDKVFVDYTGRVSLKEDPLRWCYTATSRAVETCYAVNPPHFTRFSKFEIKEIGQITKIPQDAFLFDHIPLSPFHQEEQHRCKSKKYWEILQQLEDTAFEIKEVFSKGFLERYTVSKGELVVQLDGYHKKSGLFENGFKVISNDCDENIQTTLEKIFNEPTTIDYKINYSPTLKILKELYSIMQELCEETKVPITNIVEKPQNRFVRYYLITDSISMIQFYFNKVEGLGVAMPKTYNCPEDLKLKKLLSKLSDYVI